jgi:hypothetical protein
MMPAAEGNGDCEHWRGRHNRVMTSLPTLFLEEPLSRLPLVMAWQRDEEGRQARRAI